VRLESENEFLRGQIGVKDKTIEALLKRDRETNTSLPDCRKCSLRYLGDQRTRRIILAREVPLLAQKQSSRAIG